ncbi:MAG TPA: bifunctional riboflavin kinase/FAD synthetase [Bacillota bacterium]|nr:bifunctional riboflavin kinase/FAD synthetase [Bacillota bacterium]
MEIWQTILQARQELNKSKGTTVITIGNFDGVHRGHQQIMRQTVELARQHDSLAVVLTFKAHSDGLVGEQPLLLNTPSLRQGLLAREGIDRLLEVEFDRNFAALEAEVFFQTWIEEGLHAKGLVVGYDFRFGAGRRGDYQLLKSLGKEQRIQIEQVSPVYEAGELISSSKIRQLLAEGQTDLANRMLGYAFAIEGKVIEGEQLGRKLGFPTANVYLEPQYLLPCYGVYLVRLIEDTRSFFGVANVGIKPTFGKYLPLVEVYLFDVEVNLYGHFVQIEFLKFIRPENRFSGPEALKGQIARDVAAAKGYLDQMFS